MACIWAGLFAGVLPVGFMLLFYFGPARGSELVAPWQLVLSLALGVGIILSAIGAWRGNSKARYVLTVLVVIHYGLLAYQNYNLAVAGVQVRGSTAITWGRAIRSPITAAIIAGYLIFSSRAQEFFNNQKLQASNRGAAHN